MQAGNAAEVRGQWVVCVRDIPANEDQFIGPYHSEDKAEKIAARLTADVEAVGASHLIEATVAWVEPSSVAFEDFRDRLLADLQEMGYAH